MFQRKEMRLSGSGGQGVILAAIIFADAAIEDGLNAIQTQSYGPEARGGASKAEVIIDEKDIVYPKVINNNVFLALTQKAFDKYVGTISEDCIVVVDKSIEVGEKLGNKEVHSYPILNTAIDKIGIPMVANIVSIGVLYELACKDVIKMDTLKDSIANRVPKATIEKNMMAFEEGVKLVRG